MYNSSFEEALAAYSKASTLDVTCVTAILGEVRSG